jgi:type II secretory pathway pseudopilin PulG
MIGIAILTIVISGVAPSLGAVMKRDREAELVFRGKQYARAIALFQRRYGRYPNELKELYENRPRTIRKLWKDPICNCAFRPLIQGMPDALPGGPNPSQTPPDSSKLFPPAQSTPPPGPFGSPSGENQPVGPIIGVRSTVHKEALRLWRGSKYYDEWRFIVGDADRETLGGSQPGGGGGTIVPLFPTPPK